MELLIQALEMTEGQDDYLFRMSVQPCPDFLQYGLSWNEKQGVKLLNDHSCVCSVQGHAKVFAPSNPTPPRFELFLLTRILTSV